MQNDAAQMAAYRYSLHDKNDLTTSYMHGKIQIFETHPFLLKG